MRPFTIQLEPLRPEAPLVNNLCSPFGAPLEEILTLGNLMVAAPAESTATSVSAPSRAGTALKFAFTTGLVFSALFITFNWGAYSQKFAYWYRSINPNAEKTQEQKLLASVLQTDTDSATVRHSSEQAFADEVLSPEDEKVDFRSLEIGPSKDYLVIPKLGLTVPVTYPNDTFLLSEDWTGLENQVQESLRDGVAHYPGTAEPGEKGNVFITGHSSYYPWDAGRYKDVFALLPELKVGDEVAYWHQGTRYVYEAYDVETVKPEDTHILAQSGHEYESILTLMTCVPLGTAKDRFIVRFRQTFPDAQLNEKMEGTIVIGGELKA